MPGDEARIVVEIPVRIQAVRMHDQQRVAGQTESANSCMRRTLCPTVPLCETRLRSAPSRMTRAGDVADTRELPVPAPVSMRGHSHRGAPRRASAPHDTRRAVAARVRARMLAQHLRSPRAPRVRASGP